MSDFITEAAASFKDGDAYDTHRPSYPANAVDDLLQRLNVANRKGAKIIDLAAGSGKFTEILSRRSESYEVVAVEPVESMRETLLDKGLPRVAVSEGSATDISLPNGWADAIIVAQAFHWFANEEALAEIRRVLKPGGRLGMIWNIEDYNSPLSWPTTTQWEISLKRQILALEDMGPPKFRHEKWMKIFDEQESFSEKLFAAPISTEKKPFSHSLTRDALWKRLNTLSQIYVLEGPAKQAFIANFDAYLNKDKEAWNASNEIEVHGNVFYAWTQRL